MADLALTLSDRFRLPVIDGVAAAITFAEALRACNADRWAGSRRGGRVA
jgi:Asp/Glu/hydantoin racemase